MAGKREIAEYINEQSQALGQQFISKQLAEDMVGLVLEAIVWLVSRGEEVQLRKFGTFRMAQRAASAGHPHPKTGEIVNTPARTILTFRPSKAVIEVNDDE